MELEGAERLTRAWVQTHDESSQGQRLANHMAAELASLLPDVAQCAAAKVDDQPAVIGVVGSSVLAVSAAGDPDDQADPVLVTCWRRPLSADRGRVSVQGGTELNQRHQLVRVRTWSFNSGDEGGDFTVETRQVLRGGHENGFVPPAEEVARSIASKLGMPVPDPDHGASHY